MQTVCLKDRSLLPAQSVPVSFKQIFTPKERMMDVQTPLTFFLCYR